MIVADVRKDQRPPRAGEITHRVMVRVDDAAAHCEHARVNGAKILMEPTDFEYGERQYQAQDPAGHMWTFTRPSTTSRPNRGAGHLVARPRSSRSSARRRCR